MRFCLSFVPPLWDNSIRIFDYQAVWVLWTYSDPSFAVFKELPVSNQNRYVLQYFKASLCFFVIAAKRVKRILLQSAFRSTPTKSNCYGVIILALVLFSAVSEWTSAIMIGVLTPTQRIYQMRNKKLNINKYFECVSMKVTNNLSTINPVI